MILSDKTIKALLALGQLGIQPLQPGQIQPGSVDVRIGNEQEDSHEHHH